MRQVDAGQVVTVAVILVDFLGDVFAASPKPNLAAGIGKHLGEGGAPATGTHNRNLGHYFSFFLKLPVAACPACAGSQR